MGILHHYYPTKKILNIVATVLSTGLDMTFIFEREQEAVRFTLLITHSLTAE